MDALLTANKVAQKLKMTLDTVRLRLSQRLLRGKKQGRQWRVFESALTEVTESNKDVPKREVCVFAVQGSLAEALAKSPKLAPTSRAGSPWMWLRM